MYVAEQQHKFTSVSHIPCCPSCLFTDSVVLSNISMPTEEEKKAMNCKQVQKCIANKLANMMEQEKHEWKIKKQESNQKGQATFVAKKI
jgi:hypothetical protein